MPSESDARGEIRDWLVRNGIKPREEHETGGGPADMYLGGYRVIIETKRRSVLRNGPDAPNTGSQRGETAFEQLTRQVEGDMRREQTRLDEDRGNGWVGCVTDSERWWVWIWPTDGGEPTRFLDFDGIIPDEGKKGVLLDRFKRGTQWVPPEPFFLFKPILADLKRLYAQRKGARETRIQRRLWHEQLRASGNVPEGDIDDLFVRHTLLTLIARLVGDTGEAGAGFAHWVPRGDILDGLRRIVESYDWRAETRDTLRSLYMDTIDSKSRLKFGEFYTPDWLAEKLCADTIDDGFIQEQLDRFGEGKNVRGVLDPACGSGTFLYHAARHILGSDPVKKSYLSESRRREFALSMINGLDIHPVAVEMARANMGRLFPGASPDDIRIRQGDSLLVTRPDTGLHALAEDALAIFTPGDSQFMIPNGFLDDAEGIRVFVESAKDDVEMPPGLGRALSKEEQAVLRENHGLLREIIRNEGNGVWAWYIQNQASAILLRREKVGRIVSNPPWVRFNKIQDPARKAEMERLASDMGLWVGGNVATSADISQMFAVRCPELYLQEGGRSAWVLPRAALYGGAWKAFRDETGGALTGRWNLKRLPFANTPTCVLWLGPEQLDGEIVKHTRGRLNPSATWSTVESETEWLSLPTFPEEPSEWLDGSRPIAKAGATLFPHCFTKVDRVESGGEVTTVRAMHQPWRGLGPFTGMIPPEWIHECLFVPNIMPFYVAGTTPCILPILNEGWDPDRLTNDTFRLMHDAYGDNRGLKSPQTLEDNLDFSGKLFAQFERFRNTEHQVLYNASGDVLHAARMREFHIIDGKLFSVPCVSDAEALFLTAILNAPALLNAFVVARQSDRDFVSHIWKIRPIPRYDDADAAHRRLAELAGHAEQVAEETHDPDVTEKRNRNRIRRALESDGVSGSIDDLVRGMFPNHT